MMAAKRPHPTGDSGRSSAKHQRVRTSDTGGGEQSMHVSHRSASLWEDFSFGEESLLATAEDSHVPFVEAPWEPAKDHASNHATGSERVFPRRTARARGPVRVSVIMAAAQGKLKEIQALLESDSDIDLLDTDSDGDNALLAAITEAKYPDSVLLVQALLQHEPLLATAVRADAFKYSPLISLVAGAAVRGPHADTERACQIGELLLSSGADPLHADAEGGWTFLHWSVDMTNGMMEKTTRRVRDRLVTLLARLFEHGGLKTRVVDLIMCKDSCGRDAMDFVLLNHDDEMAPVLALLWQTIGVRRAIGWLEAAPTFSVSLPGAKRGQRRVDFLRDCKRVQPQTGGREAAFPNCWATAQDFLSTQGAAWVPCRK